jgi:hypothetical protein
MQMNYEFSYDSTKCLTEIVNPTGMVTNMTYDTAPRLPEADQPVIIVDTDEPEARRSGDADHPN